MNKGVSNKITMTYTEEHINGKRVLVLSDTDGNEKFKKAGWSDWKPVKEGK